MKGTFTERPKRPRRGADESGVVAELSKKAKRKAAKEQVARQQEIAVAGTGVAVMPGAIGYGQPMMPHSEYNQSNFNMHLFQSKN